MKYLIIYLCILIIVLAILIPIFTVAKRADKMNEYHYKKMINDKELEDKS